MTSRSLPASSLLLAAAICTLTALPAFANSQARIVRLSDVQGTVQINKNTGLGFENAFLNLPITQGTELKTLATGRAEIEFEDGSTLRLAPNSVVHFSTLGLDDSGQRISVVEMSKGIAYVNWLGKDDFNLNFSRERASLDHAAHFRVDSSVKGASLAVFKGDVDVEGPSGKITVEKKKTAEFDTADNDKYTLANKVHEEAFDGWDKDAIEYHQQYAKKNEASSPYGYGLSDLNYYGSYSVVPGYGMMWQPFFTGVGWDPFMDGAWSWYPGMGYMFASPYPWGWLPYMYGNWNFMPGMGWMWQPGGWNNFHPVPHYTATNLTSVHAPVPPTGTTRTMFVGRGGPAAAFSSLRTVVARGSAGMGIPRGSLYDMKGLNHQVARSKSGFAMIRSGPQFAATSTRMSGPRAASYGGPARGGSMAAAHGGMGMGQASAGTAGGGHMGGGGGAGGGHR
jgi:hypothetical protein